MRRVHRSLDIESVKTLVHAFVTSQVDYCNSVLALSPMTITDKLQRVLNSAARLITATGKFDCGLLQLLHDDLHWLDVPQWVQYKLAVMVHRCLGWQAPSYVADYCVRLHSSWLPASAIRQSPSTHRSSRPSQHFRRSCFRHCGPNSLEFSA